MNVEPHCHNRYNRTIVKISTHTHFKTRGFTIVELLVVIVVIAILATLAIAAYRFVAARAADSTMQAELALLSKQLEYNRVESGTYIAALAGLNQGRGPNVSDGMAYQYTYDNNVSPQTFCITVTSPRSSNTYYIASNGIVAVGLCPGHTAPIAGPSYTFNTLTWAQATRPVARLFSAIATSYDGSIIVGADTNGGSGGYLYLSNDRGATWTELTAAGVRRWESVEMSASGQRMVAAASSGPSGVFVSNDAGATWTQTSLPAQNWKSVEVSSNGLIMAAGWEIGSLYTSQDGGATWAIGSNTSGRRWQHIAMSADGQTIHAASRCTSNSDMARSVDAGVTWVIRTTTPMCTDSIATSSSGQIVLTAMASTGVWLYSTDAAVTWADWAGRIVTSSSTNRVDKLDMSADGTKIIAGRAGSSFKGVYISKDSGVSWQTYSTNTGGTAAGDSPVSPTISGDGATLMTSTSNGFFVGRFD